MKKIILFLLVINIFAKVSLTPKEQQFIKEHPILILGTSIEWEPYSITTADKNVIGFEMDILNLVNKSTGIRFIEQTGNWLEIQKAAKEKKIDGLATVIKTPKREKYLNFSIPYTTVYTSILVQKGNPKHIYSEKDLKDKVIALQKGNKYNEILAKRWKDSKIIWFDTYLDLLKAVVYGKADATYDTGTAEYVTSKNGLPFLARAFHLKNKLPLRFAIRKDYPLALSILNKGLKNIPETEFSRLRAKWFLYSPNDYILTKKERLYLQNNINVCIDKNLAPIAFYKNNQYQGISVDILKIIEKKLNKKFNFTDNKCDIYTIYKNQEKYKKSIPYLKYEIVVISNKDTDTLIHFDDIKNKTIVLQDENIIKLIKRKFKNLKIIKVNTLKKQFEMAQEGYITLTIMPIYKYYKHKYHLKIISYMNEKYKIEMGIKNETLLSIINKQLKSISPDTIKAIEEKWTTMKIIKEKDYKLLLITILIFLIIIFIILFWINKLNSFNKILQENKKSLKIAKQKADENAKLKEEFLSIMSHEIKTPLNSIIGMSELLLQTNLDKKQQKYTTSIYINSKNLLSIINDILDFSKLQKNKLELSIVEFDLYKTIEKTLEIFKTEADKKELKINFYYNASKIVKGDNIKISQILINLVGNAIKFTQKGEISVIVTQKEHIFRFEIKDTGIGIDEKNQKKLFNSFTQANSSINREYGGTGLGLAISKKLVELMNGKIWLYSQKNKGSSFIFEIPLNNENLKIEQQQIIHNIEEKNIDTEFEKKVIEELKQKLKTNQPKIINPYLEEISKFNFSKNTQLAINLAKQYKFKEALELL